MAALPPPDPSIPDVNQGPRVLVAGWIQAGAAIIIVALRMYAGIKVLRKLDFGDWLMLFALLNSVTNTGLITAAVKWGVGRHFWFLNDEQKLKSVKYEFLAEPCGIIAPTAARISFAIYLLKFSGPIRWRRWTLHGVIWSQITTNLANIIIILAQCQHMATLWDPTVGGTCWSRNVQVYAGYLQGGVNCTTDLIVTFLPIIILGNLKMKLRIKIALGVLMTMSIFAFVAAVIKTIELGGLGSHGDFTYDTAPFIIWFTIENYLSIIAASVPTIRPLFLSWRKTTNGSNSYPMNSYNQKGSRGYMKQNDSVLHRSRNDDIESTPKKYPTTITINNRAGSDDSGSETNILSDNQHRKNITKTTRVDIRYEDDVLNMPEKNVSPRAF